MQLIMLTHNAVKTYFDASVLDDKGSEFDQETRKVIDYVIADTTGIVQNDPNNTLSKYLTFIYMVLSVYSVSYVKASSPTSAISTEHLNSLLLRLNNLAPGITADNILVADKMDILYGTQHLIHSEHSKFNSWFYEHVYDIAINTVNPDIADDIYEEAISHLERTVSAIEQNIIFLGQEINPDDVVVICMYPVNGNLYFLVD